MTRRGIPAALDHQPPPNVLPKEPTAVSGADVVKGDTVRSRSPLLYTPAQAAERLAITESWLRRKAGLRLIPCTFVGKHLRFSDADLHAIVAAGNRPTGTHARRPDAHADTHPSDPTDAIEFFPTTQRFLASTTGPLSSVERSWIPSST